MVGSNFLPSFLPENAGHSRISPTHIHTSSKSLLRNERKASEKKTFLDNHLQHNFMINDSFVPETFFPLSEFLSFGIHVHGME